MSRWEGLSESKVSKTGSYMQPGKYRVKINAVKWIKGQLGKEFFVVEMVVLQSNNPDIPVHSERSWVVSMEASNVMRWPNVKAFIAAASGVDGTLDNATALIEEVWSKLDPEGRVLTLDQIMDEFIIGEANALRDLEMNLECVQVTKKDGDPFTKHNWQPA